MRIGFGIFLLALGAILAFAVRDNIEAIDLTVIGYILLVAGALAIILSLVLQSVRSNTSHREVVDRHEERRPPPEV